MPAVHVAALVAVLCTSMYGTAAADECGVVVVGGATGDNTGDFSVTASSPSCTQPTATVVAGTGRVPVGLAAVCDGEAVTSVTVEGEGNAFWNISSVELCGVVLAVRGGNGARSHVVSTRTTCDPGRTAVTWEPAHLLHLRVWGPLVAVEEGLPAPVLHLCEDTAETQCTEVALQPLLGTWAREEVGMNVTCNVTSVSSVHLVGAGHWWPSQVAVLQGGRWKLWAYENGVRTATGILPFAKQGALLVHLHLPLYIALPTVAVTATGCACSKPATWSRGPNTTTGIFTCDCTAPPTTLTTELTQVSSAFRVLAYWGVQGPDGPEWQALRGAALPAAVMLPDNDTILKWAVVRPVRVLVETAHYPAARTQGRVRFIATSVTSETCLLGYSDGVPEDSRMVMERMCSFGPESLASVQCHPEDQSLADPWVVRSVSLWDHNTWIPDPTGPQSDTVVGHASSDSCYPLGLDEHVLGFVAQFRDAVPIPTQAPTGMESPQSFTLRPTVFALVSAGVGIFFCLAAAAVARRVLKWGPDQIASLDHAGMELESQDTRLLPNDDNPSNSERVLWPLMDHEKCVDRVGPQNPTFLKRDDSGSSFGAVQLVKLTATNCEVAMKTRKVASHAEAICALKEVVLIRNVPHPNLVELYDVIYERDTQVLRVFMECVSGGTLLDKAKSLPDGMPVEQAAKYTRQILLGLAHLHSNNIIHHDLNAENVLLTNEDNVKLCGYGKLKEITQPANTRDSSRSPNPLRPSPLPDVATTGDHQAGPPVDISSLGSTVSEILNRDQTPLGPVPQDPAVDQAYCFISDIADGRCTTVVGCLSHPFLTRYERPPPLRTNGTLMMTRLTARMMSQCSLDKRLGKGSYGDVHSAKLSNGSFVAVKRIRRKASSVERGRQSKELHVMEMLAHPNIVQYLGHQWRDNQLHIFLELVSGGSVRDKVKAEGRLPDELIQSYTTQALEGLQYLHAGGLGRPAVAHRDVKGDNMLVSEDVHVKLADFGCSKLLEAMGMQTVGAIGASTYVGTPNWMAPEVMKKGGEYGTKCDIWSLGCTVVEMMGTPSTEFRRENPAFRGHVSGTRGGLPLPDGVSPVLKAFLSRCFIHEPSQRASASELLQHGYITGRYAARPDDDDDDAPIGPPSPSPPPPGSPLGSS